MFYSKISEKIKKRLILKKLKGNEKSEDLPSTMSLAILKWSSSLPCYFPSLSGLGSGYCKMSSYPIPSLVLA